MTIRLVHKFDSNLALSFGDPFRFMFDLDLLDGRELLTLVGNWYSRSHGERIKVQKPRGINELQ